MKKQNIIVLGGSGFVGRHIVHRLAAEGRRVIVPARRRQRARELILLPTVEVVDADIHDDATLSRLLAGPDAVVNLVGILHGSAAQFAQAHADLPRRVAAACGRAGIRRLLHVSALGADRHGASMYLRSKGEGEAAIAASRDVAATVFRPSVIFGRDDRFLNLFAELSAWFPFIPIGGADARLQPVWVEDVATAIVNAIDNEATHGRTYELCGPRIYTLRELVRFAGRASGHERPVIALPAGIARLQAALMELAPGEPLVSRDNLDSLRVDNVASTQPYVPAPELGIRPAPLEIEASIYLAGATLQARLSRFRTRAHR